MASRRTADDRLRACILIEDCVRLTPERRGAVAEEIRHLRMARRWLLLVIARGVGVFDTGMEVEVRLWRGFKGGDMASASSVERRHISTESPVSAPSSASFPNEPPRLFLLGEIVPLTRFCHLCSACEL